jgi:hypothetical protein
MPDGDEVACTDAVGRQRVARVIAAGRGRVGIQAPPGEVLFVDADGMRKLSCLARDVLRDAQFMPENVDVAGAH